MKKIAFALMLLPPIFCFGQATNTDPLPNTFFVEERFFSFTKSFDLYDKDQNIGTVHRKFFTLTPEYHLFNSANQKLALAKMRFWSLGAIFEITDMQGNALGCVEEEFSWFFPTFTIISPQNKKLAQAELNFWRTKYVISDAHDGHIIAELTRPFFQFKDKWHINIKDAHAIDENHIHPHMFFTLIAFQVDRDYWTAINSSMGFRDSQIPPLPYIISNPEQVIEALQEKLKPYRPFYGHIEPSSKDYRAAERLTERLLTKKGNQRESLAFKKQTLKIIDLLSSDELQEKQKAALFFMIERRITP